MSNLKPVTKADPCEVCGDISGKCRHNYETDDYLCMTYADSKKSEIVSGYKCISHTKDGMWAIFKLVDSTFENQISKKVIKSVKPEQKISSLTVEQKHEQYAQLLSELTLHPEDYQDSKHRGFFDAEIELLGFKSIKSWQKLQNNYHDLPGIKNGNEFVVNYDGYLIPIRNYDCLIVGLQLRKRKTDKSGRYLWLSSGDLSAHLKLGNDTELPLPVFKPVTNPVGIAIVEGTGCKPFYVAQRLGYLTIGAAGGQWSNSPIQLKTNIERAIAENGKLPITIFPDANSLLDTSVKSRLLALIDFISSNFPDTQILIADWNQLTKKQKDIDDLPTGFNIRYLLLDSWFKKYKEALKDSKVFINWSQTRKKLTADIVNDEEWLTIPKDIQKDCDILIVRKGLGGGKTQGLLRYIKLAGIDITTFLIGYRNSLIYQTISRANEIGLSARHVKDCSEILEHTNVNFGFDDSIRLFGACADSFNKLDTVMAVKDRYFVAIDEIVSVLKHLKNGGTLKKRQQQAINWVVSAINGSEFTIVMDANITDIEVELIGKLFPDKKIKVLDSIHEPKQRTFKFLETNNDVQDYSSNAKYLPANLIGQARRYNKVLWLSDSQRSCEIADELATKDGKKAFRLDGKTSADDISRTFLNNPDEFIKSENLDWVILSPSCESGLSITLEGYFDIVCLDVRGVLDVNQLLQISARLRDLNVPIFVSCPEFVNFEQVKQPYKWESEFNNAVQARLGALESKTTEFFATDDGYKSLINSAFKELQNKIENDPLFIDSLKDNQKDIYEKRNLKICFKTALCQDGHTVIDWLENADTAGQTELKETKEQIMFREAEKIFNSPDLDIEQARILNQSEQKYDVKCSIKKALLKEQLPGIENTESWNVEFILNILLKKSVFLTGYWRLKQLQNQELSDAIFKLQNKDKFMDVKSFSAADIWTNTTTKIEAFKALGLVEYLTADRISMSEESSHLSAFDIVERYYKESKHFNLIGIQKVAKTKQYVNTMFKKFVSYFGLEVKTEKSNGEKFYQCQVSKDFQPFITDIDDCLQRRVEQKIDEASKIETGITTTEQVNELAQSLENNPWVIKTAQFMFETGDLPENCESKSDYELLAVIRVVERLENTSKLLQSNPNLTMIDSSNYDLNTADF